MSKIEPEAWKQGTNLQGPEARGLGNKGGKDGKGLVKEQVPMTHGQSGNVLWGAGGSHGECWDNCSRTTIKIIIK